MILRMNSGPVAVLSALLVLAGVSYSPVRAEIANPTETLDASLAPEPTTVPDRLVVRLSPSAAAIAARATQTAGARGLAAGAPPLERIGVPALDRVASRYGARFEPEFRGEVPPAPGSRAIDFTAFWILHLAAGADREATLASLHGLSEVASADPIAVMPVSTVMPDDSLWSAANYFYQPANRRDIHAPEAWSITTGDTNVIVAIVDTGVIPYHPDLSGSEPGLRGQLWTNWAEAGGTPGVDDDGNGFVDDAWGWDFVNLGSAANVEPGEDWRDEDNDPNDHFGHGTLVSGVVGALTNNRIGVAGTAWKVRLMALRVGWTAPLNTGALVDLSLAAKAIRYATRMGASLINCSFTSVAQPDLVAAVDAATAAGVLVVAAAGNNGDGQHYLSDRGDALSVGATDPNDKLALFSNKGAFVDLCAPGSNLATTRLQRVGTDSLGARQPGYTTGANGTSFAAPVAAGVAALVQANRRAHGLPPLSPFALKMRLMDTTDDMTSANPGVTGWGTGRINAYRALADPPTSLALPSSARTVGAAVILPASSGARRIVIASADSRLLFLDGLTGATLNEVALPSPPVGGVSAADLGDGRGPGVFVAVDDARIFGFDAAGRALAGWPVTATRTSHVATLEPVLGDVDGDGVFDVIWGGVDGNVYAWHRDGTRLPGFPRRIGGSGESNLIALSDIDGLPGAEIVAANFWGSLHVLTGDGNELPNWPVQIQFLPTPPVVTRLGADTSASILMAAGDRLTAYNSLAVQRLDVAVSGTQFGSPALADIDGDGRDEILLARTSPEQLVVLDGSGLPLTSRGWPRALGSPVFGAPVVGALVPGGGPGIAMCVRKSSGAQLIGMNASAKDLRGFPKAGQPGVDLAIDDVDGDGATEIVAGAGADLVLFVYDAGIGTFGAGAQQWPTSRGNYARTGSRLYAPPLGVIDDLAPLAVLDLDGGAATDTSVALAWSAPLDPGLGGRVSRYDIRYATAPIDESTFTSAIRVGGLPFPGATGHADSVRVNGLEEGTRYYFALRSVDAAGNASPLSNPFSMTTTRVAPAAIADLSVVASGNTSVTLAWTATGDDGNQGMPARYLIRGGPAPIDATNFDDAPVRLEVAATHEAGGEESARVTGLERGVVYHFALAAVDGAGNRSRISNVIEKLASPIAPNRGLALAPGATPAHAPVEIFWQSGASPSLEQSIHIYDLSGRLLSYTAVTGREGRMIWDGRDTRGRAMPAGIYFARLLNGNASAGARILLLR